MWTGSNVERSARETLEELRALNAELSQTLRQFETASQRAAGAAHDIRNALVVILSEAEFLARSLRDPEQVAAAQAVTSAGQVVAVLARDILESAQKARRRAPELNSSQFMASCQQLILRMLKQSVECVFTFDAELWPVTVEREQLEAALLNLVANARDAMPKGGRARVMVRNLPRGSLLPLDLPPGDYVGFLVEDTGAGMSTEVLAKATEPFFTTKGKERGTGLGLSMVKAFATESGGALQIRSEPGRGTIAEILLPRSVPRVRPLDATDPRHCSLLRIQERLRTPSLGAVLKAWAEACRPNGLPQPARLEAALLPHRARALVIAVDAAARPPRFRLVRMGDALSRALQRSAPEGIQLNGAELFASLEKAYRRALHSRCPNYQFARYCFGSDRPVQFERLILPAAVDAETVSHLFGVVLISADSMERNHEA
jgi:nitrogen-specific signal transduction histidine kinase